MLRKQSNESPALEMYTPEGWVSLYEALTDCFQEEPRAVTEIDSWITGASGIGTLEVAMQITVRDPYPMPGDGRHAT